MMKQYTPMRDSFVSDVPYHKNVNNYFTQYHNNVYCRPFFRVQEGSVSRSVPRGGYNTLSPYRESYRDVSVGPLNNFENSVSRKEKNKFVSHDELSYVIKRHGTNLYSPPPPRATQYGSEIKYGSSNDVGFQVNTQEANTASPNQSQMQNADKASPFKSPSSSSGFSPSLSRMRKAGIYPVNIFPNTPRVIPYAKYSSHNILADDIRCHAAEIISPIRERPGGSESQSPSRVEQLKAGISPEKVYPQTPRDTPYAKYSSYHILMDEIRRHQAELVSPRRADHNGGYLPKANGSNQINQPDTPKERSPYALFISHHKLDRGIRKHQVELKSPLRERAVEKKYLDSCNELNSLVSHHSIEISPGRAERITTLKSIE